MIEVKNQELLASQSALQTLASKPLSGVHSLRLRDILDEAEARLQRLQEVQQDLTSRDDLSEEEADAEWQQVLKDELEIDEEPLPEEAVRGVQIAAGDLMALDWLVVSGDCAADEGE
ncbi:hypothetical protein GGQ10_002116 [Salinibacter ruber]|uniref:hypothetical protein n=1 Tax=Salinibacter ruber TaxID=146919 RepID=UPI002168018D|nr:hypothetical protein [Salinibacter ruber]MCS4087290.1 hypothetical protein [Salinibacter ruber]